MPKLGENPVETPILDKLLINFSPRLEIKHALQLIATDQIIKDLSSKAEEETLTKEDIEEALQKAPEMENLPKEGQQKIILTHLAFNYGLFFAKLTGYSMF